MKSILLRAQNDSYPVVENRGIPLDFFLLLFGGGGEVCSNDSELLEDNVTPVFAPLVLSGVNVNEGFGVDAPPAQGEMPTEEFET